MPLSAPSHFVETKPDGKVVIHDLELFIGYDPEIDDEEKFGKLDSAYITHVVETTRSHMARGENPKLILRHDSPGENDTPVVGDIAEIRLTEMRPDVFGIVGDVEMTAENFESLLKSGRFPRRSAQIWKDGHLSEVALLGSETPARPLPDTHFQRDFFSRQDFEADMASPGSGNTYVPSANGDDDDDEDKDKTMSDKITALEKENSDLKAQLAKSAKDAKTDFSKVESERDQFKRQAAESTEAVETLRSDFTRERFGRQLDQLAGLGFDFGDKDKQTAVLDRIVAAADPGAELEFMKGMAPRKQFQLQIDQSGAVMDQGDGVADAATASEARDNALRRCETEGKIGDPAYFSRTFEEELQKLGVKSA